jgi:hypothetical protein
MVQNFQEVLAGLMRQLESKPIDLEIFQRRKRYFVLVVMMLRLCPNVPVLLQHRESIVLVSL